MTPIITRTVEEARAHIQKARLAGKKIGCVPTMGALHEGHASLIRGARSENEFVVVTVFVNPTQFGPQEDFSRYPRQLEADCQIAGASGAELVFAPSVEEMYPSGFSTSVDIQKLGDHLCGRSRPGHFRGVCTVVTKLLNIVRPDGSYFGQKDAQQARIIQQLASDLNLPGIIVVLPTYREKDGLAMSSRNRYLSESERQEALILIQSLRAGQELFARGERETAKIRQLVREQICQKPNIQLDYVEVVDSTDLQPVDRIQNKALLAVAAFVGKTRLIDNVFLL
ncbi:pantoate--beta-alanine ligase [Telmatocola sphagniphila]|uniref:Pantothenate synthetase n=1 Tax=Telmatocola sphagniphila TaxID=1123043 RepID=A0A8E6B973_9BACT|nr:pantoate--beta-alanine ligase [Telmatocola sphagniphila]QVL32868.1 pantoate--beta-alanine ligase [Telmatocola sphagniphila]